MKEKIKEKIRNFFLEEEEYDFEKLDSYSTEKLKKIITDQRKTLRVKRKFDIVIAVVCIVIAISSFSTIRTAFKLSDQLKLSLDYIEEQQKAIDLRDQYIDYLKEALELEFWLDGSQDSETI